MSYCRFSSEGDRSDFYVYHSIEGGWSIHLASQKFATLPVPTYDFPEEHRVYSGNGGGFSLTPEGAEAWKKWHDENWKMVPIDLPFAGASFHLPTRQETIDKLLELEALGYHLPPRVIERLRREIAEESLDEPEDLS